MANDRLLSELDWSGTELGAIEDWPAERRAVVQTALGSLFPICLAWGDDLVQIYNDGYNRIYGDKHPGAFGAKAVESWPEIWEFLKPALDRVKAEKQAHLFRDHLLPLQKSRSLEECYFTFCYSPIFAADGRVEGIMSVAVETTQEAIEMRRRPLTTLVIEAAREDPHPISTKLKETVEDNVLDAKSALVFKENTKGHPVEWALRCEGGCEGRILSAITAVPERPAFGVVTFEETSAGSEHADFLGYVTFTSIDGHSRKTLVLWPSALVTQESLTDLLFKLDKRLRAATEHLITLGNIKDELAQSDLVYRFLFENTLDGVVFSSPDMHGKGTETIIGVNKAACAMLGYEAEEMIGMRRDDFFFAEDERVMSAISERAQQKVFKGELVFRHKSGRPVTLEITSILSGLRSGQRRSMSILRDWTQELNVERERAERSRLESIAQMTGGIAHDFNNLLTVIVSAAEHLDAGIADLDQKEVVRDILTASSRAANLTSQLLAYARRQNLQPMSIDVNAAIRQIERLAQTVVGKDVQIHYDYSRRNLIADVDLAQLTSALVNLIKNASDAMDGRGRIVVTTRAEQGGETLVRLSLPPGKYVAITVQDTGSGIGSKILPRVFDPFFTTKADQGGSGLGLSMVQGFARQSGGEIMLQPAPGGGTLARLFLPHGLGTAKQITQSSVARPAGDIGHGFDVLVADDDPLIRRQVTRILQSLDMTYIEAGTGAEAIELLKKLPRLVLTDLAMPGSQTGIDVIHACLEARPRIPVIVMSGFAADPRWTAASVRADVVMTKPFSRDELVGSIGKLLN